MSLSGEVHFSSSYGLWGGSLAPLMMQINSRKFTPAPNKEIRRTVVKSGHFETWTCFRSQEVFFVDMSFFPDFLTFLHLQNGWFRIRSFPFGVSVAILVVSFREGKTTRIKRVVTLIFSWIYGPKLSGGKADRDFPARKYMDPAYLVDLPEQWFLAWLGCFYVFYMGNTLPETNIAPENGGFQ